MRVNSTKNRGKGGAEVKLPETLATIDQRYFILFSPPEDQRVKKNVLNCAVLSRIQRRAIYATSYRRSDGFGDPVTSPQKQRQELLC